MFVRASASSGGGSGNVKTDTITITDASVPYYVNCGFEPKTIVLANANALNDTITTNVYKAITTYDKNLSNTEFLFASGRYNFGTGSSVSKITIGNTTTAGLKIDSIDSNGFSIRVTGSDALHYPLDNIYYVAVG